MTDEKKLRKIETEGQTRWVDPDTGRTVKTDLSSSRASEMAKKRWEKANDLSGDIDDILLACGYADPSKADGLTRKMAERAAKGGAGSTTALVHLFKMQQDNLGKTVVLGENDDCPTCGASPDVRALQRILEKPNAIAGLLKALGELDE